MPVKESWARVCHIILFCLAHDNPKAESAESTPVDPVALHNTLCSREMERNSLHLLSPLSAAVPMRLLSASPVVYFSPWKVLNK